MIDEKLNFDEWPSVRIAVYDVLAAAEAAIDGLRTSNEKRISDALFDCEDACRTARGKIKNMAKDAK